MRLSSEGETPSERPAGSKKPVGEMMPGSDWTSVKSAAADGPASHSVKLSAEAGAEGETKKSVAPVWSSWTIMPAAASMARRQCWSSFVCISQHAFHHIEQHMDKTPNEYIRWRYAGGEDREAIAKDTMKISDAELELQKTVIDFVYTDPDTAKTTKTKRVIKRLTGERKTNKSTKENDYEVQFKAPHDGDDCKHFYGYKKLVKWGWDKACKKVDVKVAQAASGMFRPLTSSNVESHLKNVGLDAEFATHHRISALSGGQKVKVVLGAAMWMQPHLVILDEPTNYLDRESLGALADAIREFEGGVVIISHNNDFTTALCPETWVVEKDEDEISRPNCRGDPEWMKNALATKCDDQQAITEVTDAYGNVTEIKAKKTLTKKEIKAKKTL